MSIRALAALTVALTLTATPACAVPTPPPATTAPVMTLNTYGAFGNKGATAPVVADVLALVKAHRPVVIALQELCARQKIAIDKVLKPLGYVSTFTTLTRLAQCNDKSGGNRYGLALYTKGAYTARARYALPWGANAPGKSNRGPRALLCVNTKAIGPTPRRVCTMHAATVDPDRANQIAATNRISAKWTNPIILADFNLGTPTVRKSFPGRIMADARVTTDGGSYLDGVVGSVTATAKPVASSDHHAVIATVPKAAS